MAFTLRKRTSVGKALFINTLSELRCVSDPTVKLETPQVNMDESTLTRSAMVDSIKALLNRNNLRIIGDAKAAVRIALEQAL